MEFDFLDKEEYKAIPIYNIQLDGKENAPVFLCRYNTGRLPLVLHRHKFMQINYIYKGNMKHVINGHEFNVMSGDIFIIPPYVPHNLIDSETPDGQVIEFEFMPEFINQNFQNLETIKSFFDFAYIEPFLVSENNVKPRLNLCGNARIEAEAILNEALKEYAEKRSGYSLLIKSLALKLLIIVGREFTRDLEGTDSVGLYARHREAIYNSIRYINDHYNKQLCVEEVAKVSMLSQSYFSYLFKNITSKTFVEYLNGIRLAKAMELLKNTDMRVLDICYEVGFNNVNHFNKLFRKSEGITPLAFRRTILHNTKIS
ncbi:MAG: AraC family transcriptional regulator [Clostridiaceae bacterium]